MKRLTLVFMIDALGFEQAGGTFLPGLEVARSPVETVLGYSSACIPSIMTGRAPAEHGHLSMYRRAQNGRTVFGGPVKAIGHLSRFTRRGHWRMRLLLMEYLRRTGITGYFSLYDIPLPLLSEFDLCQRKNIYRPDAFHEEGLTGLGDVLSDPSVSRVWDWTVPEDRSWRELEEEIRSGGKRVLFFYTPELDSLMHAVGPKDRRTSDRLSEYSARIDANLRLAEETYDEVELYVFGDHGMALVEGTHDLWGRLEALPFRVPQDYLYFLDSTMARFWFERPEAEQAVRALLRGEEYGRVLEPDELERLGARFPGDDYGQLIFLLDEGHILVPSFMCREPVRGMHGYHPSARASFTTLVTNRSGLAYPKNLFELHSLLRDSIGRTLG
ncbi:MAG: alkaline phosphatase family protein [Candidatus Eisenbacteria bacterium]